MAIPIYTVLLYCVIHSTTVLCDNAGHIYVITDNPYEPRTCTFAWKLVIVLDSVTKYNFFVNPFTSCYTDVISPNNTL